MSSWFDALWGRIFQGGVEVAQGGGLNFVGALRAAQNPATGYTDVDVGDGSIGPDQILIATNGVATPFIFEIPLVAGTPGTADDVSFFTANAPFAFQVIDVWGDPATAISTKTATLRTATGGVGSALSSALDFGTANVRTRNTLGSSGSVAKGGSLVVRRSDRGIAGTVFALVLKTGE